MAKLRKFSAYQRVERAYTRASKYKKQNFVRGNPHINIVRFEMGDPKRKFPVKIILYSEEDIQIRHNAMESARITSNRVLEKRLGKGQYHLKFRIYPHHILRENPLASGAGADRMSTGMQKSFGKPIGKAARIRKGQPLLEVSIEKKDLKTAKLALKRASYKFPCSCKIAVV